MSEPAELIPSPPTSAVRNTLGKGNEQIFKNPNRPASDAALREYCDKYYHQLLSIIAEKVHQEEVQQEKMKEVKARQSHLDIGWRIKEERKEAYSVCWEVKEKTCPHARKAATRVPAGRTESVPRKCHHKGTCSWRTETLSESEDSEGGH
ncbi:hypothetical protein Tco_1398101 [Tanacetum coccineum]